MICNTFCSRLQHSTGDNMNGKRARSFRKVTSSRADYQDLKDAYRKSYLSSQRPKPLSERKRKLKDPIKPTWPRTEDQKLQSRPLIVIRPLYQLTHGLKPEERAAALLPHPNNPKWALDARAMQGR